MPSELNEPRVRIVADTNILVSGSLWSGNPGRLLDAIKVGRFTLLQTPQSWVEFGEVLDRPKFITRLQFPGPHPNDARG
jgi:predicted nucleic acid-binding protein